MQKQQNPQTSLHQKENGKKRFRIGCGILEEGGRIETPIGEHPHKKGVTAVLRKGKPSVTEYVVKEFGKYSLVAFIILTEVSR